LKKEQSNLKFKIKEIKYQDNKDFDNTCLLYFI